MQEVFKNYQLPVMFCGKAIEWCLYDYECNLRLEFTREGNLLTGEWITWEEVEGEGQDGTGHDWVGKKMTFEECKEVAEKADPVFYTEKGAVHLKKVRVCGEK